MVEFGLKLEDNKVSEWSDKYLDYEKLKAILKKAKAAKTSYDEQAKKRPEDAAVILKAHHSGDMAFVTNTPSHSYAELQDSNLAAATPTERTGLLADSLSHAKSMTSFTAGFLGSRFERILRGHLEQADKMSSEFEEAIIAEQQKTVEFYYGKTQELEKRIQFLLESVANSPNLAPKFGGLDEIPTAGSFSPKRKSKRVSMIKRVSKKIQKEKDILDALRKGDKDMAFKIELLSEEEEGQVENEKVLAEVNSIKRALIDQYRTATLLKNFAIMNYTGFVKIIKKCDKTIVEKKGRFKAILQPKNLFREGSEVDALSKRYERYYANWFCEGEMGEAAAALLPKKGDGLEMDWSQLRLGYRMGMCAVLALWVCWDCVWGMVSAGKTTIGGRAAFPVFRACGGILLLQWCWGCSVFIWSRYRVNYIYLFDFDPRVVATPLAIFEAAVDNTLVFMVLMLLYYKSGADDIPQWIPTGWFPLMLVFYTVTQLLFPLKTRVPMWESIWNVVTAPLHSPTFFHGYIGDIFTSMVKVFQDIVWTICWVIYGEFSSYEDLRKDTSSNFDWVNAHWYKNILIPIVCLFPLLIRFNQCLRRYIDTGDRFPHLANATKYALSQTVTLFGAFHPLYMESKDERNLFQIFWMLVFVCSSLYSFAWDVFMDWGLGRKKYGYLGPSLMYPKRTWYFGIMAIDLVLRFMWVLTLIPPSSGAKFEVPSYLSAVTMMLELFRRTVWGFFRLENEHRSNASGFRRVSFVPLHFNTGHQHRYSRKKAREGQLVLREVVLVSIIVLGVCVSSIIAAQNATDYTLQVPQSDGKEP